MIEPPRRLTRVAINGFGRIGRLVARAILERPKSGLQIVSINDLADAGALAWLLEHDSVHGHLGMNVAAHRGSIMVNGFRIRVTEEPDPACLAHDADDVDIVLECSGRFAERTGAERHLKAGARRVLIAGPASCADLTVVQGINDDRLTNEHKIVSNASCTTNCLSLVAAVLNDAVGIERGFTRTVHGYTSEQPLLDSQQSDLRRSRAAALSIIPLVTQSPQAVGEIIPELYGRISGGALRVPVPNVSLIEFTFIASRPTTREAVNKALKRAAASPRLNDILEVNQEPGVSQDFNHSTASAIVDLIETKVIGRRMVRVLTWYDNEWAYANRMVDIAVAMAWHLGYDLDPSRERRLRGPPLACSGHKSDAA